MPFVFKRLALCMSIAAALVADKAPAADKDQKFSAAPAASYAAHQTNAKVIIGVEPFVSGEKVRAAFGRHNPYDQGVLPILVVVQNDSPRTIRLEQIKVEYIPPHGGKVASTPAADVKYLSGARRPEVMVGPTGAPKIRKRKNSLSGWEIEGRAFAAKMLPPGESASGFFYFQTGMQRDARVYITGLTEADTGKELFYYEIPLEAAPDSAKPASQQ